MSVFRVEKNTNYTVMSNHHLRDKSLSLKAKGLLSLMLSLPDDWDYTLRGLATLSSDGIDSVRTSIVALEKARYITRRQTFDEKGRFSGNEYHVYEFPMPESPSSDEPLSGNPTTGNTSSGNPTQINKERTNKGWKNSNRRYKLYYCKLQKHKSFNTWTRDRN